MLLTQLGIGFYWLLSSPIAVRALSELLSLFAVTHGFGLHRRMKKRDRQMDYDARVILRDRIRCDMKNVHIQHC